MNCKSNAGETANNNDATNRFYQSLIDLGHGFLDVFNSFGGLVAEAFGLKADPKKSDVKNYFSSMIKKLEDTKKGIDGLPKGESSSEEGKNKESAIGSVVKEVSELLEKLITAGKEVEKVDFGNGSIGNVVAQGNGGAADKDSVKGIAKGIKGIVEAAGGKLDAVAAANTETNVDAGKLFGKNGDAAAGDASKAAAAISGVSGEQILKQIVDAAGKGDGEQNGAGAGVAAGKLFGNGGDAAAADASKAAAAISGVSGEQILKQIVDAAGKGDQQQNGVKAADAANPIAAAIGADEAGAFAKEGMKKDDQIAAAIVLRGMAKDGKFGLHDNNDDNGKGGVKNAVESAVKEVSELLEKLITAGKEVEKVDFGDGSIGNVVAQANGGAADGNSVNGIAKGIKGIVDAAGGKLDAVAAATTETGTVAGKLFGKDGGNAAAEDASKAATAISGVSGEQILKQIVAAAGKEDGEQQGVKADTAANPIAAAIG
ncbi:variable large family protein, partial [Borreliella bavariensis]|uniref:variable large family protein n=1 Tax=Borreliella bavariensis TaxID=664662 RepID=UPI001C003BD8